MNLILQAIKSLFRKLEAKIPKKLSDLVNDLNIPTPDWNQNNPKGEGYIENRPFYKEENIEELIFEGEVHLNGNGLYYFDPQIKIVEDTNYTVVFDGHVYDAVAYHDDTDSSKAIDITTVSGDLLGVTNRYIYLTGQSANTIHYVKVFIGSLRVAKKIDAMFIPEDIRKMSTFNPSGNGSFSMNVSPDAVLGECSHTEGDHNEASGFGSHAEGQHNEASGRYSHAEGQYTTASGKSSHAEGDHTVASGNYSHAEGSSTIARAMSQSVSGKYNVPEDEYWSNEIRLTSPDTICSYPNRNNIYYCDGYAFDKSTGLYTLVPVAYESVRKGYPAHVSSSIYFIYGGESGTIMYHGSVYNTGTTSGSYINVNANSYRYTSIHGATTHGKYVHIVGNGTRTDRRSNAHTLDWNGLGWFAGGLKIGGTGQDDESAVEVALKTDIPSTIVQTVNGKAPDENGNVVVEVPEGGGASSWNDLKDKPFYEEVETVTILENQECVGGTPNMVAVDTVFMGGNAVEIIYDDYAYKCTATTSDMGTYVGNTSLAGFGDDTGEPFFIGIAGKNEIGIFCAESATVSVYASRKIVHMLDEKYLYDIVIELEEDYKNATGSLPITTKALHGDYYQAKEKLLAGDIVHVCVKHRMIRTEWEFVAVCMAIGVAYVPQSDYNPEHIAIYWIDDGEIGNLAITGYGFL